MGKSYLEDTVLPRASAEGGSAALWITRALLAISGSAFLALCARASVPLPFTPVPVTLSNFGVLLLGLLLGRSLGFTAALLYLLEGASGLPVFSNGSLGLFGPTGGYLMAYPLAAFAVGWIFDHAKSRNFLRPLGAALAGELIVFAGGISWLMLLFHSSFAGAARWGVYPFLIAEVAKVAAASGIAAALLPKKIS
jgi:biotin transport system substrate-specific component